MQLQELARMPPSLPLLKFEQQHPTLWTVWNASFQLICVLVLRFPAEVLVVKFETDAFQKPEVHCIRQTCCHLSLEIYVLEHAAAHRQRASAVPCIALTCINNLEPKRVFRRSVIVERNRVDLRNGLINLGFLHVAGASDLLT